MAGVLFYLVDLLTHSDFKNGKKSSVGLATKFAVQMSKILTQ